MYDAPAASASSPVPDPATRQWVDALRGGGADAASAKARLYELLLRAARFEVSRRAASLPFANRESLDDLAAQSAGDALIAVLAKLDQFRGQCRFTTWAYKFALLEAAVALRRMAWQGREVVLDPEGWSARRDAPPSSAIEAESSEMLAILFDCIAEELTPHQRQVVVALAIDGVPIDVLAERLATTRGALYKTLHDARRKLRTCLAERGVTI